MNLLSKNAPLQESIAKMKTALQNGGCQVTFAEQKHPLPHCFSVNLSSVEAPKHIYSNGKGVVEDASVASALGEYIERLQTNNFFIDFYLPKQKYYPDEVAFSFDEVYLDDDLRQIYDPLKQLEPEDFVDFNSDYEDKIVALPFLKHSTKEQVYIPLNILSNLYVSNGLATGNTPQEAQVQALSEIFERYAKMKIIKEGYALPALSEEILQTHTRVYQDVQRLRELGYIVEVLDASLGGRFPVTAISLINPKNSTLFVSFGAHPILEVSLERTMTELMQGRLLQNLDSFEIPTFDMSFVSQSFNLESHFIDSNGKLGFGFLSTKKSFEYAPWSYNGTSTSEEYTFLMDILKEMNKESYLREYNYLGFYSCQLIVPGISEVYPMEDMLYNNKNSGKLIRDMVLHVRSYDPQDILMYIEQLEDSLNMEKYIGVIFKNNFTMREFKAQIYLQIGDLQEALSLLEFTESKMGLIVAELIKMGDYDLDFEDYKAGLFAVFGQEKVELAHNILKAKAPLINTTLDEDYKKMLLLYAKLEDAKIAHFTSAL